MATPRRKSIFHAFLYFFFKARATESMHITQLIIHQLVHSLLNSFKQLWLIYIVKRELQEMLNRSWFQSSNPNIRVQNLDDSGFSEHNFWFTGPIWEPKRPFESSRPGLFKFELFSLICDVEQEKDVTLVGGKKRRFHVFFGRGFSLRRSFSLHWEW